jgi:hypothetical protein
MVEDYIIKFNIENLEKKRRKGFDLITEIYKSTQESENERNIQNEIRHEKRLRMLEQFDEAHPNEMRDLENQIRDLMEIEQADELQKVYRHL